MIVVVKAYDTRRAVELIAPLVGDEGIVAAVQNGMTTDAVAAAMGAHRVAAVAIELASLIVAPGIIRRDTVPAQSWFAVETDPRSDPVARVLASSGTVERFDDIDSAKWMKLVSNCSTLAPTAVLGLPMHDATTVPGMRSLMIRAGQEALTVGLARGHRPLPVFGLSTADLEHLDTSAEVMLDFLYERFVVPGAPTTVLRDWRNGRRSELDALNGLVVSEGTRLRILTPANGAVLTVGRGMNRANSTPGLTRHD